MKEKVFNVKQNFFRILVLVIVVMSGSLPSRAIVVDNGNKSTEYLLDYASGEKEALGFAQMYSAHATGQQARLQATRLPAKPTGIHP